MPRSFHAPDTKRQSLRNGTSARMSTQALTRWATRNPPATNRFFALQKNVIVERNYLDSWLKKCALWCFFNVFFMFIPLLTWRTTSKQKQENAKTCCLVSTEVHLPVCGKRTKTRKSWTRSTENQVYWKIFKVQTKYRGSAANLSTLSWGLRFATTIWPDLR